MIWGINIKQYLQCEKICRLYGNKACPYVSDKESRKKYGAKNGPWATGCPLPECASCTSYEPFDPNKEIKESSSHMTNLEWYVYLAQKNARTEAKRAEKKELELRKKTPVRAELLSAQGGTASERISEMIIGGVLFGGAGALLGLLGSDKSRVRLIFNVKYADGHSEVVVEKANSKRAKKLLSMTKRTE